MDDERACDGVHRRILDAISRIAIPPAGSERVIGNAVADALRAAGIVFDRECPLDVSSRLDFFCPVGASRGVPDWQAAGIAIELKRGRPDWRDLVMQAARYCAHPRVIGLVVVSEYPVMIPMTMSGIPVTMVTVRRLRNY